MDINPIRPADLGALASSGATGAGSSVSFKDLLADALNQVGAKQQAADAAVTQLATGQGVAIDEVMIAMQKADLALQMTVQIRNKLVEAYQDISRMQI